MSTQIAEKREVGQRIDTTNGIDKLFIPDGLTENDDALAELVKSGAVTVNKGLNYGEIEVVVSNSGIDRHGEAIIMEGIDLTQIRRNPVVLWAHDYGGLPIGQIVKLWKSSGNLMARIRLDYDLYDFADTVYKMIIRGTINAVSIGGIVTAWNENYTVIEKLEMVELSVVPVGAHPDALVVARSIGKDVEEVKDQFEKFLTGKVIDKYKNLGDDEVNQAIKVLKNLTAALEESAQANSSAGEADPSVRRIKRITLRDSAKAVATQSQRVIKTIKLSKD